MNIKRLFILLFAFVLFISSLFVLSGCGDEPLAECTAHNDADDDGICDSEGCGAVVSTTATFELRIKDYFGNVPSGSFVLSINNKDGSTSKFRIKDGVVTTTLAREEHTFSIDAEGKFVYDENEARWSNDRRVVELTLYSPLGNDQTLQVACTQHSDSDTDNDCSCDACGVILKGSHVNGNSGEDCRCDICNDTYIEFHSDTDGDCFCDVCQSAYHPDIDKNYICDNCNAGLINIDDTMEGRRPANAYNVRAGATIVEVGKSDISYFIFTPSESGVYKFYVVSENGAKIGYYGAPHFVQRENTATIIDGAFTINITDGAINDGVGGTSQYVLGVKCDNEEDAIIVIERVSAPPVELPFADIHLESGTAKYDDFLNDKLVDIDIRKAVNVVYNEEDGFYHYGTKDGPLVVVKITASNNSNLPDFSLVPFSTIIETDRLCCYFYNDDGELIRKENYNTLIEDCKLIAGSRGVVPLNKTLADALKNIGEHKGWWRKTGAGANYIFGDTNVDTSSAWLFACAYVEADKFGSDSSPIVISPEENVSYSVRLAAEELVSVKVNAQSTTSYKLTLNIDEGVTVFVGSEMYMGDSSGQITIEVKGNDIIQFVSSEDSVSRLIFVTK